MMRLILLCGLFVMSLAQAEVPPEKMIQDIATKMHAGCIKTDLKNSELKPEELVSICGCTQTSIATTLRKTNFSSVSKPTPADVELLHKTQENVKKECILAEPKKVVMTQGVSTCKASAKSNPKLKGLSREKQESVCSCAANRIAQYTDFEALGRMSKYDQMARAEATWVVSIDECKKEQAAKGS